MKHDFRKLLESKKAKHLSDVEKSAKMDVLQDLKKHAMDMMGDKLGTLKKVTVASDSKEGIQKGLDKAKDMLKKSPESEDIEEPCKECGGEGCPVCESEESDEHEASETPEEETSEHESGEEPSDEESSDEESSDDMSEEELDAKIKELMKKKEAIQSKK